MWTPAAPRPVMASSDREQPDARQCAVADLHPQQQHRFVHPATRWHDGQPHRVQGASALTAATTPRRRSRICGTNTITGFIIALNPAGNVHRPVGRGAVDLRRQPSIHRRAGRQSQLHLHWRGQHRLNGAILNSTNGSSIAVTNPAAAPRWLARTLTRTPLPSAAARCW